MHPAFRSTPVRAALLAGAAAIFVINSIPSTGGTQAPADDPAIEAYIDAQVTDAGYPGASLAVIRGGHVTDVHRSASPMPNRPPGRHRDAFRHRFALEVAHGVAVMRLVERARSRSMHPSPVICRLSEPRRPTRLDHVRQLLDQTSGLPGSATDLSTQVSTLPTRSPRLRPSSRRAPPGTHYAYANMNYVVLGGVIEAASGQPYAQAMGGLVFRPLAMRDTTADPLPPSARPRRFPPDLVRHPPVRAPLLRPDLVPAGFIVSTAADSRVRSRCSSWRAGTATSASSPRPASQC